MQNLKIQNHFNAIARDKRIKTQRQRDFDLFILWLWFFFLAEQQHRLQCQIERIRYAPLRRG